MMAARGRNTSASLNDVPAFIGTLVSTQVEGGACCPSPTGCERQGGAHRQPRNRLLAVLFEKDGWDANRQGDKAERKSRALRRSGKSRRRRFCLSGRCRGRRPWSVGPGRIQTWRWRTGNAKCRDRRRMTAGCTPCCAHETRPEFSARC